MPIYWTQANGSAHYFLKTYNKRIRFLDRCSDPSSDAAKGVKSGNIPDQLLIEKSIRSNPGGTLNEFFPYVLSNQAAERRKKQVATSAETHARTIVCDFEPHGGDDLKITGNKWIKFVELQLDSCFVSWIKIAINVGEPWDMARWINWPAVSLFDVFLLNNF